MAWPLVVFVILTTIGCKSSNPYIPPANLPDSEVAILKSSGATYIRKVDGQDVKRRWTDELPTSNFVGGNEVRMLPGRHELELHASFGTDSARYRLLLEPAKGTVCHLEKQDSFGRRLTITNVTVNRRWTCDFHTLTAFDAAGQVFPLERPLDVTGRGK